MGLRDFLKKKKDLERGSDTDADLVNRVNHHPEFTFIRSDTTTQEQIYPPIHEEDRKHNKFLSVNDAANPKGRRSRSASAASQTKESARRLSQRLHLSRAAPESSENVPENLPSIQAPRDTQDKEGTESQWEKRATLLASQSDLGRSGSTTPNNDKSVSSKAIDTDIQEAIRLHEEGDLEQSTYLFSQLANPDGANNPLSQVLYGLALRHGWGCPPDPAGAVKYLSAAASNAASIEELALQAGLKKGGAAKGELVLAIFELANCFRHGWGIPKDAYAAKQYYETAANLGDSDAMNETAWCYLEGFGCKKDKYEAARYYRLAEKAGNKILGNTWIWKDKYNPPGENGGKGK